MCFYRLLANFSSLEEAADVYVLTEGPRFLFLEVWARNAPAHEWLGAQWRGLLSAGRWATCHVVCPVATVTAGGLAGGGTSARLGPVAADLGCWPQCWAL